MTDALGATYIPAERKEGAPLMRAMSLHHFRVERELSRGGMGAVFLGHDTSLDRPVALKVILPELAQAPGFQERFLREARAQARVTHSNVVQVFYVGEAEGTLYMAMELVDGGSLERQALSWEVALTHMQGLAAGLREAARLGIVHRDIKPSNVLLDRFGLAHLADFGLAAPVRSRDDAQPLMPPAGPTNSGALPSFTRLGEIMGSPPYMSPEQAHGELLDERTDIYSLGATFYELLTGKLPNTAASLAELHAFFAGPRPTPLEKLRPDIPRRFARVIDRCMERDLAKRFQNWDEVLAALERARPRPIVPAPQVTRALAWFIDFAPSSFLAVTFGAEQAAWAFLLLPPWYLLGAYFLGASPGQWVMRLRLRRAPDSRPGLLRIIARGTLQHAWTLPVALLLGAIYSSASDAKLLALVVASVVAVLPTVPGSFTAFFNREKKTVVDMLTGTRVLLDVR